MDEALLHQLLGNVYEQIGLQGLAEQEYDEAHFLLSVQREGPPGSSILDAGCR